jgi:hypothetical protein
VSSLRHEIYIARLSVFQGENSFQEFIHSRVQKGVGPSEKDNYYLICREELVSVLCIVTIVLLSNRRVFRLVSSLSR